MIIFKLNELMANHNIGQRELSRITGIRQATIGAYLNDTYKQINKDHLDILCMFFECNLDDLLEFEYHGEQIEHILPEKYRDETKDNTRIVSQNINTPRNNIKKNIVMIDDPEAHIHSLVDAKLKLFQEEQEKRIAEIYLKLKHINDNDEEIIAKLEAEGKEIT